MLSVHPKKQLRLFLFVLVLSNRTPFDCKALYISISMLSCHSYRHTASRSLTAPCRASPTSSRSLQTPVRMASTPIQEYIDKHGLQKKVEDVLNSCVQAKPTDPLAFMVRAGAARPARWNGRARVGQDRGHFTLRQGLVGEGEAASGTVD